MVDPGFILRGVNFYQLRFMYFLSGHRSQAHSFACLKIKYPPVDGCFLFCATLRRTATMREQVRAVAGRAQAQGQRKKTNQMVRLFSWLSTIEEVITVIKTDSLIYQ